MRTRIIAAAAGPVRGASSAFGSSRVAIAFALLLCVFASRPAHGTAPCGSVAAPIPGAASSVNWNRVDKRGVDAIVSIRSAAGTSVVFTLDTIFINGFDCSTGGPYGGGEPSGSGGSVSATIVDQNNAPVSGQPTYICGLNLCSPPHSTDSSGNVSVSTSATMTRPAFRVGDAINYPLFAVPLPPNSTTNFGIFQTGAFPAIGSGAALTPGTDAVSGDVTLSIPVGANVLVDELNFSTSDQQKLRTVRIPVTAASAPLLPCQNCGFEMLYGVTPEETTICPAAKLTIVLPHEAQSPNDFNWPPGAIVEIWTTTADVSQTYAPYAGWRLISYGHVSTDAMSLTSEAWGGLNFLEHLAVRLAQ
jgi:hypothetical protein